MLAVAAPPAPKAQIICPPTQRMILSGISWATYESLLSDHIERGPRFAYDRGLLELMTTGADHERDNRALALIVEVVAEERGVEALSLGSMTFKREDLKQGFEPDTCFFIQHVQDVFGISDYDPTRDPPPDLVIEVDVTNSSLNRFPIYAGFGVPEVWRLARDRVSISRLEGTEYRETRASAVLPPLTDEALTRFVAESRTLGKLAWLQSIRAWVREQVASTKG
jgi:Uma2 family endonuclease